MRRTPGHGAPHRREPPRAGARHAHHRKIFSPWRPFLRDPHDDMVLEVAVEAQCRHIVVVNPRAAAGVEPFGLRTLRPGEFLAQRHEDA